MIAEVLSNKIFVTVLAAILICQLAKLVVSSLLNKKLMLHVLVENGGMPSGHSTLVASLSTIVGLIEGFDSTIFFVTLFFSLIVLRDAFGVRRSVDKVIMRLNEILLKEKLSRERIHEIVGHTFTQVLAGVILGVAVGLVAGSLLA